MRQPNLDDVTMARLWAEQKCSPEHNSLDLMEYKLLELWSEYHASTSAFHTRRQTQADARIRELETAFGNGGCTCAVEAYHCPLHWED